MFQLNNISVQHIFVIQTLRLSSQTISIEGQSGSGKSTLLRLLNNLDNPTSGSISYKSKDISSIPPQELRKKIVMVPQHPVIFDGTVRDNLLIGLKLSCEKEVPDEQLRQMLEMFWLHKDLEAAASDLSGGEKQRVALARVLLMEKAEVFLLDEPSSELDDKTTDHVIGKFLQTAQQQHQQTIIVTHDHHVSKQYADDVIFMDHYQTEAEQADGVKEA